MPTRREWRRIMITGPPRRRRRVPTRVLWTVLISITALFWAGYTVLEPYTGFGGHSFWDWLELVGISTAIGFVGWIVARRQQERDQAVALEHTQDEALRAYLDQMSNLMIDQKLGRNDEDSVEESVRTVAQARTIAILLGLDSEHKRRPLKLVYELGLINKNGNGTESVIELKNAGLDRANLSELTLRDANLRCADLRAADLTGADLSGCDLTLADLRGANLRRANLQNAILKDANLLPYDEEQPERWSRHKLTQIDDLSKEKLHSSRPTLISIGQISRPRSQTVTILREAVLVNARLHNAYLAGADLTGADLREAELDGADLTKTNLRGAVLTGIGAEHLSQEQIKRAIGDDKTTLPSHLHPPASWSKSAELEQNEPRP
jgi:uncharacterized protein YjbI with pentapeptide repeats